MANIEVAGLVDLIEFGQDRTDDEKLADKLRFAESWGEMAIRYSRQYRYTVQESILPSLQIVNNGDRSQNQYWEEGSPLVVDDFEVVLGAAEILSRFWVYQSEFKAWTQDLPYENLYGNWMDPATGRSIDIGEALILQKQRKAA
jgi:hypothetical protein